MADWGQSDTYGGGRLSNGIKDEVSQIGAALQDQGVTLSKDDFSVPEPPELTPPLTEIIEEKSPQLEESGALHDSIKSDNFTNPMFELWLNGGQSDTYGGVEELSNEIKDEVSQIGAALQDQGVTLSKDDLSVPESPEPTPPLTEIIEEKSSQLEESGTLHDSIKSDIFTNPKFELWLNGGQSDTYGGVEELSNEIKDEVSQIGAALQDQGVTLSKDDLSVPESPEEF